MALEAIHRNLIQLCAPNELPPPAELQSTFEELSSTIDELIEIEEDIAQPMPQCNESKRLSQLFELREQIVNANGGFVDNSIGFASFANEGVGLRAEADVKAGQLLMKVPRSRMLTHSDALLCPAWQAVGLSDDAMCQRMPNACLALYLLHHRSLGSASPHSAYLNCLPTAGNSAAACLSVTPAGYRQLSNQVAIRERVLIELRNTCRQYLYFYRLLGKLRVESKLSNEFPLLKPGCFTYAAYRWAVAMVMSRNNAVPTSGNDATTLALVPLWDMGNHRFGQMSTDYSPEEQCLLFYAMEDAPAGSQLYFMYGQRSNADFFLYSGFVIGPGGNPYDTADFRLGLNPKDRLIEAKIKQLAALGMERSQLFRLPMSDPLQPNVLAFARLMCAQTDADMLLAAAAKPDGEAAEDLNRRAGQFLVNRCRLLASGNSSSGQAELVEDLCARFAASERAKFLLLVDAFQRWTDSIGCKSA